MCGVLLSRYLDKTPLLIIASMTLFNLHRCKLELSVARFLYGDIPLLW